MSLKVNIAVLISGSGSNLEKLIIAQYDHILVDGTIKLVVSNKADAYGLVRANNHHIETLVIRNDDVTLLNEINKRNIQLIVLAGYLAYISPEFIKGFKGKIINIHPSLIPAFCGKGFYGIKVHQKALEYGVKVSGATVHYVNEIYDGGQIIMQKAVDIDDNETPESLQKKILENVEWKILPLATQKVCLEILKGK